LESVKKNEKSENSGFTRIGIDSFYSRNETTITRSDLSVWSRAILSRKPAKLSVALAARREEKRAAKFQEHRTGVDDRAARTLSVF